MSWSSFSVSRVLANLNSGEDHVKIKVVSERDSTHFLNVPLATAHKLKAVLAEIEDGTEFTESE